MTLQEIEQWESGVGSAAVVDFDMRRLVWMHENEKLEIPKIAATYNRLLTAAWPGYVIEWASDEKQLSDALGIEVPTSDEDEGDSPPRSSLSARPRTVMQVLRITKMTTRIQMEMKTKNTSKTRHVCKGQSLMMLRRHWRIN